MHAGTGMGLERRGDPAWIQDYEDLYGEGAVVGIYAGRILVGTVAAAGASALVFVLVAEKFGFVSGMLSGCAAGLLAGLCTYMFINWCRKQPNIPPVPLSRVWSEFALFVVPLVVGGVVSSGVARGSMALVVGGIAGGVASIVLLAFRK